MVIVLETENVMKPIPDLHKLGHGSHVVSLVESLWVQRGSHAHHLDVVPQLVCHLGRFHPKPA